MSKLDKKYKKFYELINKFYNNDLDIIVIGANDGKRNDPICHIWNDKWNGIFIEPHPEAFNKLKKNYKTHITLNIAIGHPENIILYTMSDKLKEKWDKIKKQNEGSSLTSFYKNNLTKHLNKKNIEFIDSDIKQIEIPSLTYEQLLSEYNIKNIDILQLDTEGMEKIILDQILKSTVLPKIILYEHKHLYEENNQELVNNLKNKKYKVEKLKDDTLAYRIL